MKKMLLSAALAALVATPALAQTVRQHNAAAYRAFANQPVPVAQAGPYGFGSGVVVVGGRIVGQDPDPNVQLELRRDTIADY